MWKKKENGNEGIDKVLYQERVAPSLLEAFLREGYTADVVDYGAGSTYSSGNITYLDIYRRRSTERKKTLFSVKETTTYERMGRLWLNNASLWVREDKEWLLEVYTKENTMELMTVINRLSMPYDVDLVRVRPAIFDGEIFVKRTRKA